MFKTNTSLETVVDVHEREFELKLTNKQKKHQQNLKMLQGKNLGRWDYQEHLKYYIFLAINEKLFEAENMNRNNKIFKLMAKHIPTRTSQQCRSHHQKIKAKWSKVDTILENLAIQFGGMSMKEILQNYDGLSMKTSSSTVEKSDHLVHKEEPIQCQMPKESIQLLPTQNQQYIYQFNQLDQQIFKFEPYNNIFEEQFFAQDQFFNFM